MKYLIKKNVIIPINKVTKDIEEKSIKYSGYTHEGDEIDIYDLENGKLAPIVRYLIEGDEGKRNNFLLWGILIGLIIFAIILVVIFIGDSNIETKQKTNEITKVVPLQQEKIMDNDLEIQKIDNSENELKNEVEMMTNLKNESDLQIMKINYELEKNNIKIQNLLSENKALTQKNEEYENIIKNHKKREINYPKDEFIYYLGDNIYKKCENALNEQISNNCKELYFNYLKYAENNKQNGLYTNKNEIRMSSK